MKRIPLLLVMLLFISYSYGQTFTVQAGPSFSRLDWKININSTDTNLFNKILVGYSVFAGCDYLEKKYFNLSSNIGLIRKGGKDKLDLINVSGENMGEQTVKATMDYITVNTTFDLKYPIKDKIIPYISLGPRFDYLMAHSKEINDLDNSDELNKYNVGLILGGGVKYNLSKIQLGIQAHYYLNFEKIADKNNMGGSVKDNTFIINLTIGYRLK